MSNERTPPRVGMKVRSVRQGRQWAGWLRNAATIEEIYQAEGSFVAVNEWERQMFTMAEWAAGDIVPVDEPGALIVGERLELSKSALDRPSVGAEPSGGDLSGWYDDRLRFFNGKEWVLKGNSVGITLAAYRGRLARALFDDELWGEAELIVGREITDVHNEADGSQTIYSTHASHASIRKTLDVMWNRTKPETRKAAERKADRLLDHVSVMP